MNALATPPWIELPLGGFDLETTSADPLTARIVSACLVLVEGGRLRQRTWLLNPGIEIPDGAAAVHGITTEKARAEGLDYTTGLREIADAVTSAWASGYALAMYNGSFDCTVMASECLRASLGAWEARGLVVDPYVIDRHCDPTRPGSRRLAAVVDHYGLEMGQAHTADADAVAATRLAWVLGRKFPDVGALTARQLMAAQERWHDERQADFRRWLSAKAERMREQAEQLERQAVELLERAASVNGEWPVRRVLQTS
ncbi:exonuclease domain-containing protein [Nocardia sp. CA-128927]|uniref:exonuclease domain-containing protein n=1 Tax=Nocardia sp. CA-128927 TaxID=3239975 RepID=UPI003D968EF3